jgi:hypothetical protein
MSRNNKRARARFDGYSRRRAYLLPVVVGDESCPPSESCPICDALGIHVTGAGIVHSVESEREETPGRSRGPLSDQSVRAEGSS